jgi:hypothetical protein
MHERVESKKTLEEKEIDSLRREIFLRIFLQNVILILSTLIFSAFGLAVVIWPNSAWLFCVVHAVASGSLSLQWCHHGAGTVLLKKYIMIIENNSRTGMTWESWLPKNRPKTLLGTRWLVSTKGVFIGLQVSLILLCSFASLNISWHLLTAALIIRIATSAFLFTNPKGKDVLQEGREAGWFQDDST